MDHLMMMKILMIFLMMALQEKKLTRMSMVMGVTLTKKEMNVSSIGMDVSLLEKKLIMIMMIRDGSMTYI